MDQLSRRQFFETAGSVADASFVSRRDGVAQRAGAVPPKITLACADYLRFTPLATGDLRPRSVDLTLARGPRSEMLRRATSDPGVGGGETSMLAGARASRGPW